MNGSNSSIIYWTSIKSFNNSDLFCDISQTNLANSHFCCIFVYILFDLIRWINVLLSLSQLINAVSTLDRSVLNQLHVQLMELRGCKGHKQCNPRMEQHTGGRDQSSLHQLRTVERKKWPRVRKPPYRTLNPIWDGWKGWGLWLVELLTSILLDQWDKVSSSLANQLLLCLMQPCL